MSVEFHLSTSFRRSWRVFFLRLIKKKNVIFWCWKLCKSWNNKPKLIIPKYFLSGNYYAVFSHHWFPICLLRLFKEHFIHQWFHTYFYRVHVSFLKFTQAKYKGTPEARKANKTALEIIGHALSLESEFLKKGIDYYRVSNIKFFALKQISVIASRSQLGKSVTFTWLCIQEWPLCICFSHRLFFKNNLASKIQIISLKIFEFSNVQII